jgi:hypothetical protein
VPARASLEVGAFFLMTLRPRTLMIASNKKPDRNEDNSRASLSWGLIRLAGPLPGTLPPEISLAGKISRRAELGAKCQAAALVKMPSSSGLGNVK